MGKKLLIDATHAEETRVVVLDGNKVEDFDFETIHKRQLAGNIYLAKVTRVEPSLQAAFVDYGGNRHGFLAFAEIHPDYYQIPVADRQALLAEERALARAQDEDEGRKPRGARGDRGRNRPPRSDEANGDQNGSGDHEAGFDPEDRVEPGGLIEVAEVTEAEDITEAGIGVIPFEAIQPDGAAPAEAAVAGSALAESAGLPRARSVAGMEVVDLDDAAEDGPAPAVNGEDEAAFRPADHAERDSEIESVADEDVSDEVRPPRRPRAKRYKIQEVIKVRQIMLVQVVKEERGNKGAALTTYLSLAGRYCVLMPNTGRGGGISRKITNVADRKKLKEIASEMEVPEGAGLIIRTAGANRTKPEIKRDYEYLFRLWEQIRDLTLKSIAPAPIYEEGDLIKRSIRDLYNKDIDEVLVEGEAGFRAARDFMKMIMPSHAKNVKHYTDPMPLFARNQVEGYLAGMFNPTVQLKSGGYIVIGVTEALVAIDINSGKSTREGSIEDTALKTNLEAADEIARQLRLRDLAGLIVIDFIDMEERRNNAAVEKRLKDALRNDRARIQVGRISGFGLLEMSRQRLRPGMLEATTQPCAHCHGTGLIRSDNSIALAILRALEEEGVRNRSKEVLVKAPVGIVNYLFNQKREHLAQIEARYGMAIRIEADPGLISPDYSLEKFKTATRVVRATPVVSLDAQTMSGVDEDLAIDEDEIAETEAEAEIETADEAARAAEAGENGDGGRKKRRRRRRRRGGEGRGENGAEAGDDGADENGDGDAEDGATDEAAEPAAPEVIPEAAEAAVAPQPEPADEPAEPVKKKRVRSRKKAEPEAPAAEVAPEPVAEVAPEAAPEAAPAKPKRRRKPAAKAQPEAEVAPEPQAEAAPEPAAAEPVAPETAPEVVPEPEVTPIAAPEPVPVLAIEPEAPVAIDEAAPTAEPAQPPQPEAAPAKPRRAGWWNRG